MKSSRASPESPAPAHPGPTPNHCMRAPASPSPHSPSWSGDVTSQAFVFAGIPSILVPKEKWSGALPTYLDVAVGPVILDAAMALPPFSCRQMMLARRSGWRPKPGMSPFVLGCLA